MTRELGEGVAYEEFLRKFVVSGRFFVPREISQLVEMIKKKKKRLVDGISTKITICKSYFQKHDGL